MLSPIQPPEVDAVAPTPWETLFDKQLDVFNVQVGSDKRHPECPGIVLVDGARETGKTISVGHLVCRHLWETPGARAALIVKITGSATDGGVWLDMVNEDDGIVQQWCDARVMGHDEDTVFEYTTRNKEGKPGPISDGKTRTIYFRIRNYYGGESELRLISLQHEHEIAARFKSTRFSLMWFSELSNFNDPKVFSTSWEQLRMRHLQKHRHLWIADTNPAEEGEDSWIYKQFIKKELDKALLDQIKEDDHARNMYESSMRRIHFQMSDNPYLTKTQIAIKRAHYAHDPGELARNCDGEWTKGHGNQGKHFADLFIPTIHVIGDEDSTIEVHPTTTTLYTGWDIGSVAWHSMGIMEKRVVIDPKTQTEFSIWSVLDEVFSEHEQIQIGELGVRMLDKMNAIEEKYNRKFDWRHWSDESALNVFRASSGTFDYWEIQNATGGKIILNGVPRPDGSVVSRVRIIRRLLADRRLFIAGRCKEVISMMKLLRRGTPPGEGSIKRGSNYVAWDRHKHTFDWISYVLFMECGHELFMHASRPAASTDDQDFSVALG